MDDLAFSYSAPVLPKRDLDIFGVNDIEFPRSFLRTPADIRLQMSFLADVHCLRQERIKDIARSLKDDRR